jgi:hypothetical protein
MTMLIITHKGEGAQQKSEHAHKINLKISGSYSAENIFPGHTRKLCNFPLDKMKILQ